jgi:negative regulator of sigma E activity
MDSIKPAGLAELARSEAVGSPGEGRLDKLGESLSALMDDEAADLELRRLLKALPENPELVATWKRFHTVRASLRRELHTDPALDLLPGIKARLALETDHVPPLASRLANSRLLRYLGQGAIAASVAFAALMGVSFLQSPGALDSGAAAMAISGNARTPVLNGNFRGEELARSAVTDPEALQRIEQAVYQEFSDLPDPEEIPVSYNPDFPTQARPRQ